MQKAVFSPTFGKLPSRIVGRDQQISDFITGLEGWPGHPERSTFFIGQRGMGKTALLIELGLLAEARDFVAVRVAQNEGMMQEILEGVQVGGGKFFKEKKRPAKSISAGAFGFSFGLTFSDGIEDHYGFRTKVTALCERLAEKGKGILFLIDEVTSSSSEIRQFAATYQQLVGDGANVALAMAGLPGAISAVLNDEVLTFLNRARKSYLGELAIPEVSSYYASVFADLGLECSASELSRAARASRGYPYMLQLVGYHLLRTLGDARRISPESVDIAVRNSLDAMVGDVFYPVMRPLTDVERRFLKATAADGRVAAVRERLGVSSAYVQNYRKRLIEAGIISSPRRGELDIDVPYFKEYLRGEFAPSSGLELLP
ncbi:MAG: hypothetical protein FWF71_04835 [Actinomycetia bacterium]|nr:hypothetical protein [Actinomycetes bacterium]